MREWLYKARHFLPLLLPYWKRLCVAALAMVVNSLLSALRPWPVKVVIATALEQAGQVAIGEEAAEPAVGVGEIECLHKLQAGSTRRRLRHPICFQAAAISDDHKRTRCHGESLTNRLVMHDNYALTISIN